MLLQSNVAKASLSNRIYFYGLDLDHVSGITLVIILKSAQEIGIECDRTQGNGQGNAHVIALEIKYLDRDLEHQKENQELVLLIDHGRGK